VGRLRYSQVLDQLSSLGGTRQGLVLLAAHLCQFVFQVNVTLRAVIPDGEVAHDQVNPADNLACVRENLQEEEHAAGSVFKN